MTLAWGARRGRFETGYFGTQVPDHENLECVGVGGARSLAGTDW